MLWHPHFLSGATGCLALPLLLLLLLLWLPSPCSPVGLPCRQQVCADDSLQVDFSREVGDSVTMRCRFAGLSQRSMESLQWFGPRMPTIPLTMGDKKFIQDPRLHLGRATVGMYEEWSLTIDFLELSDAGEYRCGFNAEQIQFVNRLNVTEPNLRISYSGSPVEISVPRQLRWGHSAKFECWSYRDNQGDIDLNWSRGLRQSKRLELVTLSDGSRQNRIICWFSLDNVTLTDGGNYTCVKSLLADNRVLGTATAMLGKVRLSSKVRQLLGSSLYSPKAKPPPQPLPPQLNSEPPYNYPSKQDIWLKQQQQLQQQQQRLPPYYRGTKTEGVILNDAGPSTAGDRQSPPMSNEPDFSYRETRRRYGTNSGSSAKYHLCQSALTYLPVMLFLLWKMALAVS